MSTQNTNQTTGLDTISMIASLDITRWTGRKTDKRASDRLTTDANAKANTARVSKDLIPREPILRINQAYDAAYKKFKHLSLPWDDSGRRLIPSGVIMQFMSDMHAAEAEFWGLVRELEADYSELRDKAEEELGSLFHPDDYPTAASIPQRFSFSYDLEPVPVGDIRVQIPDSTRAELTATLNSKAEQRMEAASRNVYHRIHDAVSHMVRVLSADKPRIYDSLVEDVQALIGVLPDLNMMNDPQLTHLTTLLDQQFRTLTTDELRENKELRIIKAVQANGVLDQMAAML